ncbi:hypothetical protein HLH33_18710 [Gluconacetobacter diazotrophicus]|uniref:Uncharacterized protein n=1 Tax=Gluconacetobacter diazotrophicus TaxID=33996 RepID=A0A7W4I8M6_GLUDI|nr:hypothetical protein [Gluconacetobacter diazotrophicus]MBB2158297.1 hypothetical protein [Gluconacetobacter diazotrophicus]
MSDNQTNGQEPTIRVLGIVFERRVVIGLSGIWVTSLALIYLMHTFGQSADDEHFTSIISWISAAIIILNISGTFVLTVDALVRQRRHKRGHAND